MKNGGKLLFHFVQMGPADRYPNQDVLEVHFFHIFLSFSINLGLGGDLKGDWVQTGGAVLVQKGGNLLRHFTQSGPGDHLSNKDILKVCFVDVLFYYICLPMARNHL